MAVQKIGFAFAEKFRVVNNTVKIGLMAIVIPISLVKGIAKTNTNTISNKNCNTNSNISKVHL
jgi:hypothetical protein